MNHVREPHLHCTAALAVETRGVCSESCSGTLLCLLDVSVVLVDTVSLQLCKFVGCVICSECVGKCVMCVLMSMC